MNSPYEVIIRPIVSERAFDLMEQASTLLRLLVTQVKKRLLQL